MNKNRLLFTKIQTLPLSMHHKWKEISDIAYKSTMESHRDQIPTKSPFELKGNSLSKKLHASINFDCQHNYGDGDIYWLTCIHIQAAATGRKNNRTVQLICANKATTPSSCTVVTITELMKN
jgi:hypothetical protein